MSIPQIIDIILLVIVLIAAIRGFKNGFFTAVIELFGNIVGLVLSWILSRRWAPMVFEKLFRDRIAEKTFEYIQDSANAVDIQALLQNFTGNLPADLLSEFTAAAENVISTITTPSPEVAQTITDTLIGPVVTVIIAIVIFVICCSVCSLLASLLAKALRAINHIPVVGFANRMAGFGMGVLTGIVEVIIISCVLSLIAIITENSLSFINMELLNQSRILTLTGIINPFIG